MSQPAGRPEDLEGGIRGVSSNSRVLSSPVRPLLIADDRLDRRPLATPNQPSQGESNFGDSSGPFFSMYSKVADDEDNKMVERWQKDADGILFFVSPRISVLVFFCMNWITIDRSILCRSRRAPCRNRSGPQAKQSGYLGLLPREHLSGSRRPGCTTHIYPLPCP
jgi:hypothetical protein